MVHSSANCADDYRESFYFMYPFNDNSINVVEPSNFAKAILSSIASSLLGPEGDTWSMEQDRRGITFHVTDPADLARLEQQLSGLELIEPCTCTCTSQPCTCQEVA
jgi:hypothetical protein